MARDKSTLTNIDNSDPGNYLNGRLKDNTGGGDGTPVNERVYGDFHQTMAKLMQLAGLAYNNLPDNETNGYQLVDAIKQLASKNDYNYELSRSGSVLSIPLRVSKLTNNEVIRAKSTINKGSENQIKGTLDNTNKSVSYLGSFKQNEYVRLINLSGSIVIIREVDAFNLNTICEELGFLKAASNSETLDNSIDDKSVTPKSFLNAISVLLNGSKSDDYLASASRNGLLSAAQQQIIANLGTPPLRNRGDFVLGDIGGSPVGTTFVSNGQISAQKTGNSGTGGDVITITFDNAMDSSDYRIDSFIQSLGNSDSDNDVFPIVFKTINTNSGEIIVQERAGTVQNIKIHIDVIQL